MSTAPRIQVIGLRKVYPGAGRDVVALDGIDVSVQPGEIHGIVGRSGAGKSTLIRCLTVLERPTSGSVVVDSEELSALPEARLRAARRRIGLVFQHVNLLDSRTVAGNVAYPLEVSRVPRAARDVFRHLMDGVDPELVDAAETALLATPGVQGVESLRLRWIGHRIHAEVGLTVDARLDLVQAHDVAHDAQHRLLHDIPKLADATVHVIPTDMNGRRDYHAAVAHHQHQ